MGATPLVMKETLAPLLPCESLRRSLAISLRIDSQADFATGARSELVNLGLSVRVRSRI